jgi:hypothetical protein
VGTEQFTNEFIGAIQTGQMGDFRRRFREIDLLLVDDVQFLKGKESTQEEFFHTFNAIYEAGRQIVLTSDRPPKDIPGLESRLVSRFEWGMVANVDSPDLEHRIAILKKKASLDHLELTIPDEVIEFIAQHVKSSVRELEGSIIKLLAYASLKHRDISVDLAREALRDKLRGASTSDFPDVPPTTITVATIQQVVAREWGVTPDGPLPRTPGAAARGNRQRLRWPRSLHGDPLSGARRRRHGRRRGVCRAGAQGPGDVGNSADNRATRRLNPRCSTGPHILRHPSCAPPGRESRLPQAVHMKGHGESRAEVVGCSVCKHVHTPCCYYCFYI